MKLTILLVLSAFVLNAQKNDSTFIKSIYNEALSRGESYQNLKSLCKDIGARLSGSAEAAMAIEWGKSSC